jgi:cobalt-precorrin-5B (C1)-methyltransferase
MSLKTGFTTGAAAAAAAKAALRFLLDGRPPHAVTIEFLSGGTCRIPVFSCRLEGPVAACTVIKDAGDDPDVTHLAEIGARVTLTPHQGEKNEVRISGGKGVGRVTRPGLEVPVGRPAINAGPREMIRREVEGSLPPGDAGFTVAVEVFVPEGERLARKTLNARLGILSGISILGTTGVVRPMSHGAFTATIDAALSVARAGGQLGVVLTTGRRSERFARALWPERGEEAFIQAGDYFAHALQKAAALGFETLTLAVFFGKAVKMAQGIPQTHADRASLNLWALADWAGGVPGHERSADRIRACNTARQAFEALRQDHLPVIAQVAKRILVSARKFAGDRIGIGCVLLDYEGNAVFSTLEKGDKAHGP